MKSENNSLCIINLNVEVSTGFQHKWYTKKSVTHSCLIYVPPDLEELLCVSGYPARIPFWGRQKPSSKNPLLLVGPCSTYSLLSVSISSRVCVCTCVLVSHVYLSAKHSHNSTQSAFTLIPFCIFKTPSSTCNKTAQNNTHTETHKWVHIKRIKSE